jgi:hypothetical protein
MRSKLEVDRHKDDRTDDHENLRIVRARVIRRPFVPSHCQKNKGHDGQEWEKEQKENAGNLRAD